MSDFESRVARTTLVNVFGNGFRVVISFVQAVFVAKWLGVDGFGQVSLILSYTSFLHYLFMLGFDHTLPVFLANSSNKSIEKPKSILLRTLYLSFFASIVGLTGLGLLATLFLKGTNREVLLIPGIIIAIQMELSALGYLLGAYFRSFRMFSEVIIREQIIFPLISFLGMVLFIRILGLGILGYAWGFFAASFAALIYMILTIKKVQPPDLPESEGIDLHFGWRKQLFFSLPVGLMATLEPIFNYSTVVVSSWQLSDVEIGFLGVSTRLGFFMTLALLAISPIFTPFLAMFKQNQNLKQFESLYQKVIFWCLGWSLLSSFVSAMLCREVVQIFGTEFSPSWPVFLAMLPGLLFEGAFGATKLSLVMAGHNLINMYNLFAATIFNGFAIYLGNHYFGVVGGASAFSLTLVGLNFLRIFQIYKIYKISPINRDRILILTVGIALFGMTLLWNFAADPAIYLKITITSLASLLVTTLLVWPDRQILIARLSR